jgi:hypothetical protein
VQRDELHAHARQEHGHTHATTSRCQHAGAPSTLLTYCTRVLNVSADKTLVGSAVKRVHACVCECLLFDASHCVAVTSSARRTWGQSRYGLRVSHPSQTVCFLAWRFQGQDPVWRNTQNYFEDKKLLSVAEVNCRVEREWFCPVALSDVTLS